MSLFLALYSGLWSAGMPFLRRNKRLAEGFDQRLAPCSWPWGAGGSRPEGPVVWMQAASGGEAGLVARLAPELESLLPEKSRLTLLATTCTRQGLDILEKIPSSEKLGLVPRLFPLDKPELMRRALGAARPDLIVLLETELWPGLMDAAKQENVPILVLNARMTAKSLSGYAWLTRFWQAHKPEAVLAVSQEDAGRFGRLFGPELTGTMPNIKFDSVKTQVQSMEDAEKAREKAGIAPDRPVIALASVRREEEEPLRPVVEELGRSSVNGRPVSVIIAPRHMHRVRAWQSLFPKASLASQGEAGGPLVIWDVFGRLKELYAASDAVFVGGSLAPLGGQNFLEAPAQGVRPVIGPHWKNFYWAGRDILDTGLVEQTDGPGQLGPKLLALAESRLLTGRAKDRDEVRRSFLHWLEPRTGGAAQAASCIMQSLGQAPAVGRQSNFKVKLL